jgi:2-phospho-L-lactate/phosphoenolpyruvate guanylyltransferase
MRVAVRVLARSGPMSEPRQVRYGVLVPIKPTRRAKSRLAPLGDAAREALVRAFATDTVTAALSSPAVGAVMVVTDDHRLAAELTDLGVEVLPDGVADDLNASLVEASAEMHRRRPELALAALCADLPALTGPELTQALDRAAEHPVTFVADASGVGTTLVTASTVEQFRPRFGSRSREEHVRAGARPVDLIDVPTLRRDVDTPDDLREAVALGVGERTAEVVAGLRL